MPSIYGEKIHVSIFGQSHSAAIGVVIDGLPAGVKIDMAELGRFMARRAPGQGKYATARKEADLPEFVSGVVDDVTCGAPVCALNAIPIRIRAITPICAMCRVRPTPTIRHM